MQIEGEVHLLKDNLGPLYTKLRLPVEALIQYGFLVQSQTLSVALLYAPSRLEPPREESPSTQDQELFKVSAVDDQGTFSDKAHGVYLVASLLCTCDGVFHLFTR
jgi:hypothetical protein